MWCGYTGIALSIAKTNPLFVYYIRLSHVCTVARVYIRISFNEEAFTAIISRILVSRIEAINTHDRLRGLIYLIGY